MKRNLTSIASLLFMTSLLFQGCVATIISTSKQGVKISSKPSNAIVYLDDKKVGNTPIKVRVKRKDGGEIKIEKVGYKPHIELLYPYKANPLAFLSLFFGGYPYFFDMGTGATQILNKRFINVDIPKIPNKIDGSQTIYCDEVNIKTKAGDKLGNFYIKKKKENIFYFGETLDIDAINLKQDANDLLKSLGFRVAESDGKLLSPTTQARYFIKAEVLNIKYDVIASNKYERYAKYETKCEMNIKWRLVNRSDDVKYEATTEGISTKYEKGGTAAFYDAFENSFYRFLDNKSIYETVKQIDELIDETKDFTLIKIAKPVIKVDHDKIINHVTNSIVTIDNQKSHGSGCILSEDGYIVTNYHVVGGLKKVQVILKNGISLEGTVVRFTKEFDLALIKVNGSGYTPVPILEENEINIGSDVYAIGTPADKTLGQTVTKGIISGARKIMEKEFIQTDVSINPGSSGGGLINKNGYLIGIVNAKLVGESVEGIGFAIPGYVLLDKLKIGY